MSLALTAQAVLFAVFVVAAGLAYARWLARDFDRKYGKPDRSHPAE